MQMTGNKCVNCSYYTASLLLYSQVRQEDQKDHGDLSAPVDEIITVF